MLAVQLNQPFPRQLPQPRIERHRPLAQIFGEPLRGLGQGFLHDIRRIDARGHAAIQPDGNHASQPVPVVHEQLLARSPISLLGPSQQLFSIGGLLGHQFSRYYGFRKAAEKVTGNSVLK